MLPDRVSNPGPLIYESGALPIGLRGPAYNNRKSKKKKKKMKKKMKKKRKKKKKSSTIFH